MVWTAWNNGSHSRSGAGYGLRVDASDRDRHFDQHWQSVTIELPGSIRTTVVEVNVAKRSFWTPQCRELIDKQIGEWLISESHAPWRQGHPPRFEVTVVGERYFKLVRRIDAG